MPLHIFIENMVSYQKGMKMARDTQVICRNVFKNNGGVREKEYTQKWIELIRQKEKNQTITIQRQI